MTDLNGIDSLLAAAGFHRIGRIDASNRRSLWLREEADAIELRAGREGYDASVRIDSTNPMYEQFRALFACARFAAEWESADGSGLDASFSLDVNLASIHSAR